MFKNASLNNTMSVKKSYIRYFSEKLQNGWPDTGCEENGLKAFRKIADLQKNTRKKKKQKEKTNPTSLRRGGFLRKSGTCRAGFSGKTMNATIHHKRHLLTCAPGAELLSYTRGIPVMQYPAPWFDGSARREHIPKPGLSPALLLFGLALCSLKLFHSTPLPCPGWLLVQPPGGSSPCQPPRVVQIHLQGTPARSGSTHIPWPQGSTLAAERGERGGRQDRGTERNAPKTQIPLHTQLHISADPYLTHPANIYISILSFQKTSLTLTPDSTLAHPGHTGNRGLKKQKFSRKVPDHRLEFT
ncbi:hypothetical protein EK904_002426 [Melospiza melodia maxima]|nr:hypothetical protein EK904_002426 [Melospiza melodia maxima]